MTQVAIILAAGASSRMGQPKALLPLDGRPLIQHHIDAFSPWCEDIIVVVGAHAEAIAACLPARVRTVSNPDWAETGPAESLLLALAQTGARHGWVTPVDAPPAPPEVLAALAHAHAPCVPTFDGEPGHPVRLDLLTIAASLPGRTLHDVLHGAAKVPVAWPDTVLNLNTATQWAQWTANREG